MRLHPKNSIMKSYLLQISFFFGILQLGFGQELIRGETDIVKVPFRLEFDSISQRLGVTTYDDRKIHAGQYSDLLEIKDLRLEDGDLVFDYNFVGPDEGFLYTFDFSLQDQYGSEVQQSKYRVIGNLDQIEFSKSRPDQYEVSWRDMTEFGLYFNREYVLNVNYRLQGFGLDCDTPPKFGFNKWWPHLAGAVFGGVVFAGGQIGFGSPTDDNLANLEDAWNQGLEQKFAESLRSPYNSSRESFNTVSNIAGIILIVDALWLGLRYQKHLKRAKLYKTYCSPNPQLSLSPEIGMLNSNNGTIGLKLNYNLSHKSR